jgi:hypothetical protein
MRIHDAQESMTCDRQIISTHDCLGHQATVIAYMHAFACNLKLHLYVWTVRVNDARGTISVAEEDLTM